MSFKDKKRKGIAYLLSLVIVLIIGIAAIISLYFVMNSHFVHIHVLFEEAKTERQSTAIANVMITNENFVDFSSSLDFFDKAVLNATKLDKIAIAKRDARTAYSQVFNNIKELDIGYPNTVTLFAVVDLENKSCVETKQECDGWIGAFKGPTTLSALDLVRFFECVRSSVDTSKGSIFRSIIPGAGTILSIWDPIDFAKCVSFSFAEKAEAAFYFSKGRLSTEGLPVLIRYDDVNKTMHVGRLFVGVWKWV